jgi:hypothetical protein
MSGDSNRRAPARISSASSRIQRQRPSSFVEWPPSADRSGAYLSLRFDVVDPHERGGAATTPQALLFSTLPVISKLLGEVRNLPETRLRKVRAGRETE